MITTKICCVRATEQAVPYSIQTKLKSLTKSIIDFPQLPNVSEEATLAQPQL